MALQQSPAIWRFQQQTTGMINLKVSDYLRHEIDIPVEKTHQRRIAEILGTVDEVIEQTEALIAKQQQVKAGLMHDLFTRGLTPDGQLRPTRAEAPDLYHETPLGLIPKEWDYALLDGVAHRASGHTPNRNHPEYWDGGIKWVSLADSWRLDRVYISETDKEISALGIANSSAVLHPPGIVILSRDAGIGKSAITTCEMAVSQHFMCWRCGPKLDSHYLYYWLQYRKREFENIATGTTIPTIGLRFFKNYRLPVSINVNEQKKIGVMLLSADQAVEAETAHLAKLRQLKQGLMQALLTPPGTRV
jgi:type I restriction enzyme S subunit